MTTGLDRAAGRAALGGGVVLVGCGAMRGATLIDHPAWYTLFCVVGGSLVLAGASLLTRALQPWRRRVAESCRLWMSVEIQRGILTYEVRRKRRERQRERWRNFIRWLSPYGSAGAGLFFIWRSFDLPADLASIWFLQPLCALYGTAMLRDTWMHVWSPRSGEST